MRYSLINLSTDLFADKFINMRTPLDSPFSPGSDTVPQIWAGRTEQLSDWRDVVRPRRLAGLHERGRTILGEAGLGKSSLVRRIAASAQNEGDWVTPQLRIPSGADPLKKVAEALLRLADQAGLSAMKEKQIGALLNRVESVAASGFSLSLRQASGPEPYTVLTELLIEIGRAALRQGDVVALIHIDEVQNISSEDALSQLLIALGDALTHEEQITVPGGVQFQCALPLAVYLTGLPEFADMAGARTGATFVRRFQTTMLAPLEDSDLLAALQPFVVEGWETPGSEGRSERVFMEPEAQQAIVDLCRGEPFLFQLAGERAWYAGSGDVITTAQVRAGWQSASAEAEAHVERILARLPQRERQFVEAMAGLSPEDRTLTRISEAMGYAKTSDAGPTSRRLDTVRGIVRRGKPYSFSHRAVEAALTSEWPDLE
ncbi:ATP-binding protein [Brevibacterium album]|uniref:ATP-binding protein n=1 Tax=Brevibacterium album TaxID=417948 RepID=UPI001FDFAB16|nr:ATP-binding protein [Brevibacterium album]